ncbi:MAG: 50S ribosomal protein L13 [Candidatus Methylomirabilis sp.]|nr:50S ribosomal protein L13 [Deltaproteobacteria bacterium]
MTTATPKLGEIERKWWVIDAEGKVLGRMATQIADILRGKHNPKFVPHLDCGDFVIVLNAGKVRLTGDKWNQKVYYRHTGYMGGIKETTAKHMQERHPERLIQNAVKGMLPRNKLGHQLLTKLKIYTGPEHPHAAQKPEPLELAHRA